MAIIRTEKMKTGTPPWVREVSTSLIKGFYTALEPDEIPEELISKAPTTKTRSPQSQSSEIKSTHPNENFDYYALDSLLQKQLLIAQDNVVRIDSTDYIQLVDTRKGQSGIPKDVNLIEIIKYFRAALVLLEYKTKVDNKNQIAAELFEHYNALLRQTEITYKDIRNFHDQACELLKVTNKQFVLARDAALQRLKPIPRITVHQSDSRVMVRTATNSNNKGILAKYQDSNQDWLTGVADEDKEWLKLFYNTHHNEIEQNGCFTPPTMASVPLPRNTLTESTFTCKVKGNTIDEGSEEITQVCRLGLATPYQHPYFWEDDKVYRIRYGVDSLIARIKANLTQQIQEHFRKYGALYQVPQKYKIEDSIEFPILYSTALSPILGGSFLSEFSLLEDNNLFFLKEKEEIMRRVQEEINKNPSCVLDLEGENEPEFLTVDSSEEKDKSSEVLPGENPRIILPNTPPDQNESKILPPSNKVSVHQNQVYCNGVRIKLTLKDINNPLNQLKVLSYTRNEDVSQSNDLIRGVCDDLGRLIDRWQRVVPNSSNSIVHKDFSVDALFQLQYALSSSNVSLFGQKFGKADLFYRPWDEEKIHKILQSLREGRIILNNGDFPLEAQRELANRIQAAIHLRDLNHESIFMRGSRSLVAGIRSVFSNPLTRAIPVVGSLLTSIGDLAAGIVDWGLNTVVATILSPTSWGKALSSIKNIFKKGDTHNEKLLKTAYEILTLGSKGMVIGFCKSSCDRTTVILAAVDAIINKPELLQKEIGSNLFVALFKEMKTLIGTGMYSHAVGQHIKIGDVGYTYSQKCVPLEMGEQLKQLKVFRKALKKVNQKGVVATNESKSTPKRLSKVIFDVTENFQTRTKNLKQLSPSQVEKQTHASVRMGPLGAKQFSLTPNTDGKENTANHAPSSAPSSQYQSSSSVRSNGLWKSPSEGSKVQNALDLDDNEDNGLDDLDSDIEPLGQSTPSQKPR